MDINQNIQTGLVSQDITFSKILNSLFFIGTLVILGYYIVKWWQNTRRLRNSIGMAKQLNQQIPNKMALSESFNNTTDADNNNNNDNNDSLVLEKPIATQAKILCEPGTKSQTEGIWDGAEDGYILYDEPLRKWSDLMLGKKKYSPNINQALEELKLKYSRLIIETTKEMLIPLEQLGLENYIQVMEDLDKLVSANSQIAQLKGISIAQTELLPRLIENINNIPSSIDGSNRESSAISSGSGSYEELGRQIIQNRQMREYLESKQILIPTGGIHNILGAQNRKLANELVNIADKQLKAYKSLIPLLDIIIGKRDEYEKEKKEIMELLNILPDDNADNNADNNNSGINNVIGRDGGRGQVPDSVISSDARSLTSSRWQQRYYLNMRSANNYLKTRDLDKLRTQINNPPGGLTPEDFQAKYNWIDKIGKDKLPVFDDPEINFALPAGMSRTIPDILTDFDHYNNNCQRIYAECGTRANIPEFVLPNWDTSDYYDYLDRLPNAKDNADGITPTI